MRKRKFSVWKGHPKGGQMKDYSSAVDKGTPFVFEHSNSVIAEEFAKIEKYIEKYLK